MTTVIASIGRATRRVSSRYVSRTRYLGAVTRGALQLPRAAYPVVLRTVSDQIRFTAIQAVPFVLGIGLLIGLTILGETMVHAARFGLMALLGEILVTVVIRELGPLLTAIIVIGRSGTAIAAEIATNDVLGETTAIEALGVDPYQLWVLPRVIAGAVSVTMLIIYFDVVTVLSGLGLAEYLGRASFANSMLLFREELSRVDLSITIAKGILFGGGIALLCTYEGFTAGGRPTAIPQCVTRGVVASLAFVFTLSALFSAGRFLL